MRINQNVAALNAWRNLSATDGSMGKSLERLSSGMRINKAADDAAGLAISEKMRGQVRGLNQAVRNSQDAISLIQTAEGALSETHAILQRMRELAVQAASDTSTKDDRLKIQTEVDELAKEVTRISNTSEFNTKNLLAGGFANQTFQIGANQDQSVKLTVGAMDAYSLGLTSDITTLAGFAAGTSGISSVVDASSGLVVGTGYEVDVTKTIATTSAVSEITKVGTAAVPTAGGAYTGATDKAFRVEVTAGGGAGAVTQVKYSTDGGATYTTAAVAANVLTLEGVTLTFAATNHAVGDTYSYSVTAEYATLQLQEPGNINIGSAAKVYNNQSAVTVGDSATDRTATANFTFASLAAGTATFNIVAGTASSAAVIGANGTVSTNAVAARGISVATQGAANLAISSVQQAMETVSSERSKLGALQNRLEHTISNLSVAAENLTGAESRIRDVDMASEMAKFTRAQILLQAGTAMMAQANQKPQAVLQLLR